jgi:hypothetical protein
MIDIPTETLSVERYGAGSWDTGVFVRGAKTDLSIEASVQPLTPNEVKILPEHRRDSESFKIYTETELLISNEINQTPSDVIIRNGKKYEILAVNNWYIGTDIQHYKSIAVKIDDQGSGQ